MRIRILATESGTFEPDSWDLEVKATTLDDVRENIPALVRDRWYRQDGEHLVDDQPDYDIKMVHFTIFGDKAAFLMEWKSDYFGQQFVQGCILTQFR